MTKSEYKEFSHKERYRNHLIKIAIKNRNSGSDPLMFEMMSTTSLESVVGVTI